MTISDKADPQRQRWRFLEIDWITYAHTAIYRPVMVRAVGERIVPDTVSFCRFPQPSLILNYFNDPEKDIYLDFCRSRNIPVFRVISSGGPIWGDTGYIFTFLHITRDNPLLPPDVPGMFEKTLTGVAEGISQYFQVECRFRPLNDLEIKCEDGIWRKIGPSSCFYDEKAIQMGSGIQVKKPDDDLIAGAICAPPEKFVDKETKTLRDRITYLERLVGRDIDLTEIRDIYWNQVQKTFGVELFWGGVDREGKRLLPGDGKPVHGRGFLHGARGKKAGGDSPGRYPPRAFAQSGKRPPASHHHLHPRQPTLEPDHLRFPPRQPPKAHLARA